MTRENKNLKQHQLALLANVSRDTVIAVETGQNVKSVNLLLILDALGIPLVFAALSCSVSVDKLMAIMQFADDLQQLAHNCFDEFHTNSDEK